MSNDLNWRDLEQFSFGDSPAMADELADLVLAGRKRATCWAVGDGPMTDVGKRIVMLDGAGIPKAVLETVELVQRRFSEIDEGFAFDEGEGDRTLEYWKTAHQQYFERHGTFNAEMLLYCERFRLIERIEFQSVAGQGP
jgi:uncharacterized protein YhfF